MGVNQVLVGDEVKLDLTADTVSEDNLLAGATAHNAAGEPITGAVSTVPVDSELSEESENAIQNKAVAKAVKGGETLSGSTSYTVNDSVEYPLVGLKVFGKSEQKQYSGKNLYQGTKSSIESANGWYCILGGVDNTTLAIEDYKIPYGEELTLSLKYEGNLYTSIKYKKDGKFTTLINQSLLKSIKFTIPEDYDELFIFSRNETTTDFKINDIQIEKGSTATSYEPYVGGIPSPNPDYPQEITSVVEPTVTVSNDTDSVSLTLPDTLNAIPVSSGGNVTIDGQEYIADYVDFERGVKVQRIKSLVLTSSNFTDVLLTDNNRHFIYSEDFGDTGNTKRDIGLCNKLLFETGVFTTSENDLSVHIRDYLYVRNDSIDNIEDFKNWIDEQQIVVYGVYKTPIETPLSETELQAYRQLQTYNGTTNISNDKGAGIEGKYCTNKALSACVAPITAGLQKQIDDLKSAVLSLGGNV